MNWARQRHVPDLDYDGQPPAPVRRGGLSAAVVSAVLASAMAAGLAYYAQQLAAEQRTARELLRAREAELAALTGQHAAKLRAASALEEQRDERDALLEQANQKLLELNTELAATQAQLEGLEAERSEIREQLAEFRKMTQQFRRMIDSGRLEVTFRRGRMIVELPAQVLFPSGSADLTDEGKQALVEVAKVLRGLRKRRFVVAGHTDDVPVATERFSNNWELSTQRAVHVTQALIRGGLRPEQLVAAGYGQYDPIARNTREAGRSKNRRIEIILEPQLRPLPELERQQAAATSKSQSKSKSK